MQRSPGRHPRRRRQRRHPGVHGPRPQRRAGTPQPQPGFTTPGSSATGAAGSAGTNVNPPASNTNEQNGASGAPLNPSQPSNTGSSGNSGSNSGANQGAAGSSMVPPPSGNQGAGGASMGGDGIGDDDGTGDDGIGDDGNTTPPPVEPPPSNPPPVTPPPVTPPPAAPDVACPAGATFCSGFESDTLPDGAIYQGNPGLTFDDSVSRSGNRSVVFDPVDGFNVRVVVAPIPGQAYWARLFIQTSNTFGDNDHDSLFVASTANFQQDNNAEDGPEFSEQGDQIIINSNDSYYNASGPGFPSGQGPQLAPNVWHCVEARYDGGSGDVEFFVGGERILLAPGFSRHNYATFRFGYLQFPGHAPRTIWFDDVVVAPNRIGCN